MQSNILSTWLLGLTERLQSTLEEAPLPSRLQQEAERFALDVGKDCKAGVCLTEDCMVLKVFRLTSKVDVPRRRVRLKQPLLEQPSHALSISLWCRGVEVRDGKAVAAATGGLSAFAGVLMFAKQSEPKTLKTLNLKASKPSLTLYIGQGSEIRGQGSKPRKFVDRGWKFVDKGQENPCPRISCHCPRISGVSGISGPYPRVSGV